MTYSNFVRRTTLRLTVVGVACGFAGLAGAQGFPTPLIVAGQQKGGEARVFLTVGLEVFRVFPEGPRFKGGIRVATGDVTGDGLADLITGAGPGGAPNVRIFDASSQGTTPVRSIVAYDPSFKGGVFVAAGDVNGDGFDDIITGAGAGGAPHVKVFYGATFAEPFTFTPFDAAFKGGVRVGAGDVDGDGRADIVVGQGSGGSQVKVISGATSETLSTIIAFDPSFKGGVSVAAGDVDGDGFADVVVGAGPGGGPHVKVFSGITSGTQLLESRFAYDPKYKGGVEVAVGNPVGSLIGPFDLPLFLPAIGASPGNKGTVATKWLIPQGLFPGGGTAPTEFGFNGTFMFGTKNKGGVYLGMTQPIPGSLTSLPRDGVLPFLQGSK
jgi:hypothetical protein